jgi:glycine oxidase
VETADVIVAGAGIIGLSTALELARNGFRVRLLEKGRAMSESSWAAAGMLSAPDEHAAELAELSKLSFALYPDYLSTVEGLSGRVVRLRTRETIMTDGTGSPISAREAQERIPGLQTEGRSFSVIEEVSLDPRDLCEALPLAAAKAGVHMQEETEVLAVNSHAEAVEVTTRNGQVSGGAFVNCCGAWAAGVHHPDLERQPARGIEPRKGQIFAVRLSTAAGLPCVLCSPDVYLVPRGDGRVVIGSTVERVGFDRRVDPLVVERLHAHAAELWPPIASAPVVESWIGLRPGSSDGLPLIGNSGQPHCWTATGHFRNGILMAPATGVIMRQLLQGSPPAASLAAFVPGR